MTTGEERMPTEEELRAAFEQVRVEDVVVQTIISLVNVGGAKAATDREQLHMAIEAVRVLLPLVETELGADGAAIREALSQLQLMYARGPQQPSADETVAPEPAAAQAPGAVDEAGPGPAQSSGRLWIPGQ